jgi:hypothetical protein
MRTSKKKFKKKASSAVPEALTTRVKALWDKDQGSALELGNALLEVKEHDPHGGITKWIEKNLDSTSQTRNRCNYCMRKARGKTKPPKGGAVGGPTDKVLGKIIHEVNDRFKQLYKYAQVGDVDSAIQTAKAINEKAAELVETAKKNVPQAEKANAAKA